MLLIADSGSTKTDWRICNNSEIISFQTIGMNPYFINSTTITDILIKEFPVQDLKSEIQQIIFFGSGCKAHTAKQVVIQGLENVFTKANIVVKTDLEGAATALLGNSSGNICILGTGMSMGVWNGNEITYSLPSLGYILGDEGSGAHIGKLFIKGIFEEVFDSEIIEDFYKTYSIELSDILEQIYKKPMPNQYLAGFVHFMYKHKNNASITNFVHEVFKVFVQKHVCKLLEKSNSDSINFIGSIAFWFKDILEYELQQKSYSINLVEASPIQKLCEFYN